MTTKNTVGAEAPGGEWTEVDQAEHVRLGGDARGALIVFHRTTEEAASAILVGGFRDSKGSYMMVGIELEGVWISNRPLNRNEGAKGNALLRIVLAASKDELAEFEIVEEEKPYREWCVPAVLLNARGQSTLWEES